MWFYLEMVVIDIILPLCSSILSFLEILPSIQEKVEKGFHSVSGVLTE